MALPILGSALSLVGDLAGNWLKGKLGEDRTLYSLRHSSLIYNLSQPNVDLLDIARRADTSMKMIQDYYYPQSQLDEKLKDFLRV